jgi:hypothetical protein
MLPIRNAKLFGGLLHNPGEWRIVGVADERAQMMCDVMVEAAHEPPYDRVTGRIIGRCSEDVIDAVIEFAAVRGKVRAVDRMRGLEYQRYGQTYYQMDQHECPNDQQRRFPQQQHWQDEHVGEVERLPREEDGVFPRRMPGTLQVVVGWKKKGFKVPYENVVEREHRVKEQRIDVLEPVLARAGFVGCKPKDAASGKRIVFAV